MNIWNLSGFLKAKILRICPYGKKQLENLIQLCIRKIIFLFGFATLVLLLWNRMLGVTSVLYVSECLFLISYLVCIEVPNYILCEKENKVYREMMLYFSRVKHQYLTSRHIANAVVNAADGLSYELEQLAWATYRLLLESERKNKIHEYMECHELNRFWKMFLIQTYEVSEKGNVYFAENLEHIRLELMEEIYRRKRRLYAYSGYVFVTVTPFFMLPVLKNWGLEFTPELDFFYAGTGRILEVCIFLTTVAVYSLITRSKEITMFSGSGKDKIINTDAVYNTEFFRKIVEQIERSEGKISKKIRMLLLRSGEYVGYGKFCARMLVSGITAFLVLVLFVSSNHWQERKTILERVENIDEIAPVVSGEKKELLTGYILEITAICRKEQYVTEEDIRDLLRLKIRLGNEFTEQAVVEEINEKLQLYKKTKGSIPEFLMCVLGGVFVGLFPLGRLELQARMLRSEAEYEVRQFQSILLMERRIHGITVVGLLEDMEVFSRCYKNILRRCINFYCSDSKEALLRLKRDGSILYDGFETLADAFLSVDEVGIESAFAEVENDRRLLEKISRLDAEVLQERKKDTMELLAQIPMLVSVGIYFILPFFLYSLQSVSDVFNLLEEMQL